MTTDYLENVLGAQIFTPDPICLLPVDGSVFKKDALNLEVICTAAMQRSICDFLEYLTSIGNKIGMYNIILYVDGEFAPSAFTVRPVSGAIKSYLIKNRVLGYPFCQLFFRGSCLVCGDILTRPVQEALVRNNEEYQFFGNQVTSTASAFLTQSRELQF